jgi:hypothetical protein
MGGFSLSYNVKTATPCLMWTVWRERNTWIFNDVDLSITKHEELFFGRLFDWARV